MKFIRLSGYPTVADGLGFVNARLVWLSLIGFLPRRADPYELVPCYLWDTILHYLFGSPSV